MLLFILITKRVEFKELYFPLSMSCRYRRGTTDSSPHGCSRERAKPEKAFENSEAPNITGEISQN